MCRQYVVNVLIVFFFFLRQQIYSSLFWPTFCHTEVQLYHCEQINAWSQRSSLVAD